MSVKTQCLAALQVQRGCSYTEVTDDKSFTAWATANPIYVDWHQDCRALAGYTEEGKKKKNKDENDMFLTCCCQVSWQPSTKTVQVLSLDAGALNQQEGEITVHSV